MIRQLDVVERILGSHAAQIGGDLPAYRNHVYRLVNLTAGFVQPADAPIERIGVAAAFHDLGIWTHRTFDYLGPSIALARRHLTAGGLGAWEPEVTAMIAEHHKLRSLSGPADALVDAFRRADWVDVTVGLRSFGVRRAALRALYTDWPDAGFHRMLLRLGLERLRAHPLSPLPMLRW